MFEVNQLITSNMFLLMNKNTPASNCLIHIIRVVCTSFSSHYEIGGRSVLEWKVGDVAHFKYYKINLEVNMCKMDS